LMIVKEIAKLSNARKRRVSFRGYPIACSVSSSLSSVDLESLLKFPRWSDIEALLCTINLSPYRSDGG
jgi:hypothetical protein